MGPWTWFLVIVLAGGALLAGALLLDRRERRRLTGADEPAPARGVEAVDRNVPTYVTQDEIDAMPAPSSGQGGDLPRRGEGFAFGHAHPDFATNSAGASLDTPRVLVVDGDVTSMRELLQPLSGATPEHPLAIVAAGWHPEVLTTLAANRRAVGLPVLAATGSAQDRRRLAELLGIESLEAADLQAGYLPDSAVGRAAHWSSTGARTWVEPEPEGRTST